jgi:hypothetical protein
VTEQGIDGSRISVATGTTDGKTEENYLVPSGATFSTDVSGTTPVDETAVNPGWVGKTPGGIPGQCIARCPATPRGNRAGVELDCGTKNDERRGFAARIECARQTERRNLR